MAQGRVAETEKTYRFPLVGNNQQRNTTTDADQRFVNFFPETTKNVVTNTTKLFLNKRPGFTLEDTVVVGGAAGRGAWSFNDKLYTVFGNTLYENGDAIQVLSTSTSVCGAVEIYGEKKQLFLADGLDAWLINLDGTVTQVDTTYLKWQPEEILEVGDRRRPTTNNTYWYVVTVAGMSGASEPTWPTTVGNTVTDGTITWKCAGTYTGAVDWDLLTEYEYGDIVTPKTDNGYFYRCIKAGTSANYEPLWPTIMGDVVTDGLGGASIDTYTIAEPGIRYVQGGAVTFVNAVSDFTGAGAAATINVDIDGKIVSITWLNKGGGYQYAPTVDLSALEVGEPGVAATGGQITVTLESATTGVTWECIGQYGGFPTPHIPTPVYLDGYVFLAELAGRDIYNSDVNQPTGWGALSFITAENFPDPLVGLARQNNYVVAFGTTSTELFYDKAFSAESSTAITTQGLFESPLQRNESIMAQVGCLSYNTVLQSERLLLFIGSSAIGGKSVWMMNGTSFQEISLEYVEKFLDAETDITGITGYGFRVNGHLFFHINLPTLNRTFVYDVEEKMWHEWSYNGVDMPFIWFVEHDNKILLQHRTDGCMYQLAPTIFTDNGVSITCDAITAKLDFETDARKFYKKITVIGDTQATALQLRWSDDDYSTWNDWKTLSTGMRPILWRAGASRRRAYNLRHVGNTFCRLEALEMIYTTGEN